MLVSIQTELDIQTEIFINADINRHRYSQTDRHTDRWANKEKNRRRDKKEAEGRDRKGSLLRQSHVALLCFVSFQAIDHRA